MDKPKIGTQVLCDQCGAAIEWRGEYWDHLGENKPRHLAIPKSFKAVPKQPSQWMAQFDERTQKHIVYARAYAREFAHGAPGHLDLMTIAALAQLLDDREPHESGEQAP